MTSTYFCIKFEIYPYSEYYAAERIKTFANKMDKFYKYNADQKKQDRSQPGGIVVKFLHSTSVAQGTQFQILGADLCTTHQAMQWWLPTYKIEEDGHRC